MTRQSTHQFSTNRPREGSWVLYLNGIETPAQGVRIHTEINQIPTAQISLAPDPELVRLGAEDRVEAQVFYKDDSYSETLGKDPDFRLLYDGAIHGQGYNNTGLGRSLSFNSADQLHLLDTLNPFFITGPDAAAAGALAAPTGQAATMVHSGITFPWSLLFYGFGQPPKSPIRRPFDFVENILRSSCGQKELPGLYSVVTSNFYARQMGKIGFPKRFVPSPIIETELMAVDRSSAEVYTEGAFPMLRTLRSAGVVKALQRKVQEMGLGSTMWQCIQGLFSAMYYEVLSLPNAPIAQVEKTPNTVNNGIVLGPPVWGDAPAKGKTTDEIKAEALTIARAELLGDFARSGEEFTASATAVQVAIKKRAEELEKELQAKQEERPTRPNYLMNYITKPQWVYGIAPTCNVVFPSMIEEMQFSEDYMAQPTRLYVNDLSLHTYAGNSDERTSSLGTLRYGYPEQIQREMDKKFNPGGAAGASGNPIISGKNLLVWPEEFYKGPVCSQTDAPNWVTYVEQHLKSTQTVTEQLAQEAVDRIDELLLTVEINAHTAAVKQVEQERPELFEVTDTQSIEEKDELIAQAEAQIRKELVASDKARRDALIKQLQETGFLDENITSLEKAREIIQDRAFSQELSRTRLQRVLARYEYFRQRGAARSASVTMPFNPYIVPGYPAFVFDDLKSGQHIIGYVVSVTHDLSTESMRTTANMTYVQTLDEFVHEVFDARVGNTPDGIQEDLSAAPPMPISELRDVLQTLDRAEEYFSLLLHQGDTFGSNVVKRTAFNFEDAVLFVLPGKTRDRYLTFQDAFDESVEAIIAKRKQEEEKARSEVDKKIEEKSAQIKAEVAARNFDAVTAATELSTRIARMVEVEEELAYQERLAREFKNPRELVSSVVLDSYVAVRPSRKFAPMFHSYDQAMKFISRPICTLDEYIDFRGKWGQRRGTVPYNDYKQGKGAKYYERILNLTQGPGTPPTFDENNNIVSPSVDALPDTRFDWQTKLLNYRKKILFGTADYRYDGEE